MGGALEQMRTGLLCTVFAVTSACSIPEQATAQVPVKAPVQNYYLNDGTAAQCALIDGRGTNSASVKSAVREIRTTLSRFPMGLAAVADLDSSKTALCFTDGAFLNKNMGVVNEAEYKHNQNLILLSGTDAGYFMHEWKHKHDGVDFDSFEMSPFSAVLTLRFAEAGAYAYEVMARHEAKEKGVTLRSPSRGTMISDLEAVYDSTLSGGGSQEQAWRNTFDASFRYSLKNIQTGAVLNAYEQALSFPHIRNQPGFAQKAVTPDFLKTVALPPGWDVETFLRTGSGLILGDERYITYQDEHAAQLDRIQAKIAEPLPAVVPNPR